MIIKRSHVHKPPTLQADKHPDTAHTHSMSQTHCVITPGTASTRVLLSKHRIQDPYNVHLIYKGFFLKIVSYFTSLYKVKCVKTEELMISSKPLPVTVSHSSAPGPYRFVSNTTGWWTEFQAHMLPLCVRLFFILLNEPRLPHPTTLFKPVFYSCRNKATHFKELAKTTSFSFFLKDRKYH